jgi:type I restriction enzyme, S subunit
MTLKIEMGKPSRHTATINGARAPLAELRAGWRAVRFGDVVRNVNDNVRNFAAAGIERVVGLEHLDPDSLRVRRWSSIADGTTFTRVFKPGQILFGKRRAYQRKAAVVEFAGVCSGDILVFEPVNDLLLPELLPFIVHSDGFFDHALGTSAGSLSPRTRWKDLAAYEFALPPLVEQRRIAELLWAVDEAIVNYEESSRLSNHVRKQQLSTAVLKGIEPITKLRSTDLGDIPVHWDVVKVTDI